MLRRIKTLALPFVCVSLALGVTALSTAWAQSDDEPQPMSEEAFRADILRLLKMIDSDKLGQVQLAEIIKVMKRMIPDAPEDFWGAAARDIDADAFTDRLVPIYAEHLSHEDVIALIAFYESPAGRHFLAARPHIIADSIELGQAYAKEVQETIMARLERAEP